MADTKWVPVTNRSNVPGWVSSDHIIRLQIARWPAARDHSQVGAAHYLELLSDDWGIALWVNDGTDEAVWYRDKKYQSQDDAVKDMALLVKGLGTPLG